MYLTCLRVTISVIKHHDQSNLQKKILFVLGFHIIVVNKGSQNSLEVGKQSLAGTREAGSACQVTVSVHGVAPGAVWDRACVELCAELAWRARERAGAWML